MMGLVLAAGIHGLSHARGMPLNTSSGAEVGLQLSHSSREEDDEKGYFMNLKGRKIGLMGSFTQSLAERWYWGGDLRISWGDSNQNGSSSAKGSTPETHTDTRLTLGRDFPFGNQMMSTYLGLGYRTVSSDILSGSTAYERNSNYTYMPLGLTHRFRLGADARFATTFEYDYLIEGLQQNNVSGYTNGTYTHTSGITMAQRKGRGMRLQMAYETTDWSAGLFFQHWDIGASDVGVGTGYDNTTLNPLAIYGTEARNITREIGVQLKYRF